MKRLFIGCSVPGLEVAKALKIGLAHAPFESISWNEYGGFVDRRTNIENLEHQIERCTHAVMVLTPDELIGGPEGGQLVPRDNVIFELGLFWGRLGRQRVFILTPKSNPPKLFSDIDGLVRLEYGERHAVAGFERFDIESAASQLSQAIVLDKLPAQLSDTSTFWKGLSSDVRIIYGVERAHKRSSVSLRDLNTAMELNTFLQQVLHKTSIPIFSTIQERHLHIPPTADLIVVGGFITNDEFAVRRNLYESNYSLRMGRLCRISGQRVFHVDFTKQVHAANRSNPYELESIPSEHVSRDYGLITSQRVTVYGHERRVISIAGIKGNGTLGAARTLMMPEASPAIDRALGEQLNPSAVLQAVVESWVTSDRIDRSDVVELKINEKVLLEATKLSWTKCELGTKCAGCSFGLLRNPVQDHTGKESISAIAIDLDDTLLDTFTLLISPLEEIAAKRMIEASLSTSDVEDLTAMLLQWRRKRPKSIDAELRARYSSKADLAIDARNKVFEEAVPDGIHIPADVRAMLKRLSGHLDVHLVTSGSQEFQGEKLRRLSMSNLIPDGHIHIVDSKSGQSKLEVFRGLALRYGGASKLVVIGNRIDDEIEAGIALGSRTIWVRRGEGAGMHDHPCRDRVDHVTEDVLDIEQLVLAYLHISHGRLG